jgi:hypothetical protein
VFFCYGEQKFFQGLCRTGATAWHRLLFNISLVFCFQAKLIDGPTQKKFRKKRNFSKYAILKKRSGSSIVF